MKDDFLNRYRCNTKSKVDDIDDNPQSCGIVEIDFSTEIIDFRPITKNDKPTTIN